MNAETIKALADLAWPVLAAVVLVGLLPTLRNVIQSRNVTIKYGQMEVSVQDAADQLRRQVEDLKISSGLYKRTARPPCLNLPKQRPPFYSRADDPLGGRQAPE